MQQSCVQDLELTCVQSGNPHYCSGDQVGVTNTPDAGPLSVSILIFTSQTASSFLFLMQHWSMCWQSGCTTGRLGSSRLQAMPSERQQSWHSGSQLPLLRLQAAPLSMTTTGWVEQPEDEPRRQWPATAAGIRATRKSLLQARWSSWQTWAGVTPRQAYSD